MLMLLPATGRRLQRNARRGPASPALGVLEHPPAAWPEGRGGYRSGQRKVCVSPGEGGCSARTSRPHATSDPRPGTHRRAQEAAGISCPKLARGCPGAAPRAGPAGSGGENRAAAPGPARPGVAEGGPAAAEGSGLHPRRWQRSPGQLPALAGRAGRDAHRQRAGLAPGPGGATWRARAAQRLCHRSREPPPPRAAARGGLAGRAEQNRRGEQGTAVTARPGPSRGTQGLPPRRRRRPVLLLQPGRGGLRQRRPDSPSTPHAEMQHQSWDEKH